ncbi:VOC family protein [Paenibacillus mucilaginosus]|uniref:Glyoxalase/bleomycin resistance protein/dioxygenase n=3 Tax=Paenibacillus mucilaginosus TaxID=61624 RepID=H6NL00_9BACL|nr:VOC family protein [Paenibacillus mucilaginosus]AEI40693.1 Glyoxalase/bleomycin resistance protein/dioxygenase [Paenibacillus mucilaginosus KNP414]AFC29306.1 Glyoxalase/bleomycin resistance protein/dioxygenase [Paenibacillus mucilaginosus 3016]AFH61484.1 glyoxalase [Paenibacillus mucilaginosus K02]MCG7211821.1 VOC family protein [Paenibacillus mucilaginosus]WDM29830.1 VOC family protein [Paenibacillus mucilaginosus]
MKNVKLEGLTLLADDVARLARFYQDVLGFTILIEEEHYVEFSNSGVRLAICSKSLMAENTNGYPSFRESRRGQAIELNFQCDSPDQVYALYDEFVSKGAIDVTAPQIKSWGHTTGFFGDPEGNIHSIFAVNPV